VPIQAGQARSSRGWQEDGRTLAVKTDRLYSSRMKLVNVRLDEEDARAVSRLRAKGISLSDVVRRAVRAEDQRTTSKKGRSEQIVAEALARFPTPRKVPPRMSALDRRAVQRLIRSRLRRSS
jgi:Arc/MetJ-type ribon-helix-helix transcriptional regulator